MFLTNLCSILSSMLYDSPYAFSTHQIQEYYRMKVPAYFCLPLKNKSKQKTNKCFCCTVSVIHKILLIEPLPLQ